MRSSLESPPVDPACNGSHNFSVISEEAVTKDSSGRNLKSQILYPSPLICVTIWFCETSHINIAASWDVAQTNFASRENNTLSNSLSPRKIPHCWRVSRSHRRTVWSILHEATRRLLESKSTPRTACSWPANRENIV